MTSKDAFVRRVRASCRDVLSANWREGVRDGVTYGYTSPSPETYPWQWYWDSCFAAIVWRRLDPSRARRELESLLAAARPDGFIGHTIFWGSPVTKIRSQFYNVMSRQDAMTSTIQPPHLAWAWSIAVGDPSRVPRIVDHHRWIQSARDLRGDGLVWIIQPDESGLDASPQFDAIWGRQRNGRVGFRSLVARNRRLGFDARAVQQAGFPVVLEPLTNTLNNLSRLALGWPSATGQMIRSMWDPARSCFRTVSSPETPGDQPVTIGALAPLALPDLPPSLGRRMVEEHLKNPLAFRTLFGPPSVSLSEPSFSVDDRRLGLRQYWRGPTWINTAWLVWMGVKRLGYRELADEIAVQLASAVVREGSREYYNPFTGEGMGAKNFAWSTLVLDMIANDPAAERSYLAPSKIPKPPALTARASPQPMPAPAL